MSDDESSDVEVTQTMTLPPTQRVQTSGKRKYTTLYDVVSRKVRWKRNSGWVEMGDGKDPQQRQQSDNESESEYDSSSEEESAGEQQQQQQQQQEEEEDKRRALTPDDQLLSAYYRMTRRRKIEDDDQPPEMVSEHDILRLLPDSGLLESIHYYASRKFEAAAGNDDGRTTAYRQFDDTALLAMGILVEEYIKSMLGPDSHLMYAKSESRVGYDTERSGSDSGSEDEPLDSVDDGWGSQEEEENGPVHDQVKKEVVSD